MLPRAQSRALIRLAEVPNALPEVSQTYHKAHLRQLGRKLSQHIDVPWLSEARSKPQATQAM